MEKRLTIGWHGEWYIRTRATIGLYESGEVIRGVNPLQSRKVSEIEEFLVTKDALRNLCPPKPAYRLA